MTCNECGRHYQDKVYCEYDGTELKEIQRMKCSKCIHYNVCLGYRNIDYDGDSNSCPYAEERPLEDKREIQAKLIDKVIDSIAEQYSKHNTLVPYWLNIGDIRIEEAEND